MFKQHVALGDAIVRDVPNVELVRAGIRHHHERWDGDGYLEGLEGEEIPLIGRILAVADAFSAMTTTRPYRKALPLTEALKRLGDAAGTQLQEELVTAFIAGHRDGRRRAAAGRGADRSCGGPSCGWRDGSRDRRDVQAVVGPSSSRRWSPRSSRRGRRRAPSASCGRSRPRR